MSEMKIALTLQDIREINMLLKNKHLLADVREVIEDYAQKDEVLEFDILTDQGSDLYRIFREDYPKFYELTMAWDEYPSVKETDEIDEPPELEWLVFQATQEKYKDFELTSIALGH